MAECKSSVEALQKDMRGFSDVQAKMEHKIASFIAGLQEATEGLAEVRAHMSGQFWDSVQGMHAWCRGIAARDHWGSASSDNK